MVRIHDIGIHGFTGVKAGQVRHVPREPEFTGFWPSHGPPRHGRSLNVPGRVQKQLIHP